KIESTGKGLNIRHIVSNLPGKTARDIYFEVYVQRGEASENRIKEVKNMCHAGRLSCHRYWANFLRLLISSLARSEERRVGKEGGSWWWVGSVEVNEGDRLRGAAC